MVNTDIQMWIDSIEELRALTLNFRLHFTPVYMRFCRIFKSCFIYWEVEFITNYWFEYKILIETIKSSGWFFNQTHVIGQRRFCLTLWKDVLRYCFVFHRSIVKWARITHITELSLFVRLNNSYFMK